MAKGKYTCKILKELRRRIAEANDINLVIEECTYKGDCLGTCPRCEAELRYLEQQLTERRRSGKAVAIAGISAGMLLFTGCSPKATASANDTEPAEVTAIDTTRSEKSDSLTITTPENPDESPLPEKITAKMGLPSDSEEDLVIIRETTGYEVIVKDPSNNEPDPNRIYDVVEKKPQFPGGDAALLKYVADNIVYPDTSETRVKGRVVVQFVVKKDGSIGDVKIIRSKSADLDKEAYRVVKSLPNFTPGEMKGEPVNVWYTIPINFK